MLIKLGDTRLPIKFWNRVKLNEQTGCWEWQGQTPYGYGRAYHKGKEVLAHRLSYLLLVGDIASGLVLDHVCRVRSCVNPAHLEVVTPAENSRRSPLVRAMIEESAQRSRDKTHCPSGHEYAGENLILDKQGHRVCRECKRAALKKHYAGNGEKLRANSRAYHAAHREERKAQMRAYYHSRKSVQKTD